MGGPVAHACLLHVADRIPSPNPANEITVTKRPNSAPGTTYACCSACLRRFRPPEPGMKTQLFLFAAIGDGLARR
jgi:hypothetical protein